MKMRKPLNWGRVVPALVIVTFTGVGIGEALAGVVGLPRLVCNIAGFAVAIWLISMTGRLK